MSPILVVDSSDIREGRLEEVRGAEDLVAFVEANEAEPIAYDTTKKCSGQVPSGVR